MAKNTIPRGQTSVIRHIFIMDSASTAGAGKTALAYNTASISAYYIYPGGTATSLTLETISTLGTYSAPTSGAYMRFKEIDATNMPGWYELHFHNDWFSVANARKGGSVQIKGATGMAPVNFEFDVIGFDLQDDVPPVDVTAIGGSTQSLTYIKDFADTGYDPVNHRANSKVVLIDADAVNASALATDAITEIQNGLATPTNITTVAAVAGSVGSVTGNVGGNVAGSVGSVTGAVGSVTGAVGSVTGAVGSVTGNVGGNVVGSVGSVATGGISAASLAADASNELAAGLLATDIVSASALHDDTVASLLIDAGRYAQGDPVETSLATTARAELAARPAANAPIVDKLTWLVMLLLNKIEQTATTKTLYADNGSTTIATSDATDDGTTFTSAEWVSGP